jgi:hypothetical protein
MSSFQRKLLALVSVPPPSGCPETGEKVESLSGSKLKLEGKKKPLTAAPSGKRFLLSQVQVFSSLKLVWEWSVLVV